MTGTGARFLFALFEVLGGNWASLSETLREKLMFYAKIEYAKI